MLAALGSDCGAHPARQADQELHRKARHVLLPVTPGALTTITAQCRERLGVTGDVSGATGEWCVMRPQTETLPKQNACRDTSPVTSRRSWHGAVTVAKAPGVNGERLAVCSSDALFRFGEPCEPL